MNKISKLYIFHEYGAINHYRALCWYADCHENFEVEFREFSITRKIVKGLISLDFIKLSKQFKNLCFLAKLILTKSNTIIVGIAPYDWRLMLYYPILKRHNYFYHTSNPHWGYTIYPKKILANNYLSKKIWRKFIENSKGVFCATEKSSQGLLGHYTIKDVAVVNHSIESGYILNKNEVNFEMDKTSINCLFVARITESKGIRQIFNIIKELPEDEFTFSFAGDGDMKEMLIKFVEERKNCSYLGYLKNPRLLEVFKYADTLLMPSIKLGTWEELFGMSIIEAMACATVPITTNHAGPLEIINQGYSGYLFSEKDYVMNTVNLLKSLKNSQQELSRLKENAYKEAKKYKPDQIFNRWNELLKFEG